MTDQTPEQTPIETPAPEAGAVAQPAASAEAPAEAAPEAPAVEAPASEAPEASEGPSEEEVLEYLDGPTYDPENTATLPPALRPTPAAPKDHPRFEKTDSHA